jgi:hypothetical protein
MWSSLVKIQYTELNLSCGNDPVVKNYIYSNDDLDLVYWILTKPGHMIPLWKGKNPIYFGVISQRSNFYLYIMIEMYSCILT